MEYHFTVPGRPHPCMRARRSLHGGMYDPARNEVAKETIGMLARAAGVKPIQGAVEIWINFIFRRPESHLKKNGDLRAGKPVHHTIKPDTDNLVKTVKDALSGIAWADDCQVVAEHAEKCWTTETDSMTIITIEEVT